jgi:uncharacterized protein (DUF58 family)
MLATHWQRLQRWFTLDQRLALARPAMLWLGLVLLLLAVLFPSRWLLYILYVHLLLLLGAYLWVRSIGPQLRLLRQIETTLAQVGDELEERWSLDNRSPWPLHWLEIDDASTLPGYQTRRVVFCEAGKQYQWRTSALCERRGSYTLGPLTARFSDPLDIFRFEWRESTTRQLVVYPPLVRLPPLVMPGGQRGGLAQADLLQLYATPSVGGIRDYAPGDPPSRIHWPQVARHGRLVVKEFDQERAGAIWLLLDLHAAAYPSAAPAIAPLRPPNEGFQRSTLQSVPTEYQPPSLLELAITLTAALAAQLLAEGRSVGLLCNNGQQRMVAPGSSARQLWPILNELVVVEANGEQPLAALFQQSPGAQNLANAALMVITPALDGAWVPGLAARSRRPGAALALLVANDAVQATPCVAQLARVGIAAHITTLGTALPLVHAPRRVVTARVSPLGRVVRAQK